MNLREWGPIDEWGDDVTPWAPRFLLFVPTALSILGTLLEVDIDARFGVVLNGPNVSAAADQSGNGNDVTQVTPGNQPLFVDDGSGPNGVPFFEGDGVSEFLSAAFSLAQPNMVWCVCTPSVSAALNKTVYDGNALNSRRAFTASGVVNGFAGSSLGPGASFATDTWHKSRMLFDNLNGENQIDADAENTGTIGAGSATGIHLFGNAAFGDSRLTRHLLTKAGVPTYMQADVELMLDSIYGKL